MISLPSGRGFPSLLCTQLTFADSIKTYSITSISMQLYPNDGPGDDFLFVRGPPHPIFRIGRYGVH